MTFTGTESYVATEDLRVAEQLPVPLGREAAPDRRKPRFVEGIYDHRDDRDVEEGKTETQDGEEEGGALAHYFAPSAAFSCILL